MKQGHLRLFEGYGIELEYMIVDRDSLDVLPVTDRVIHAVSGTFESEIEMGPLNWSNELVLHVIELKTNGPAQKLEPLPDIFQSHVKRINSILDPLNGQLLPTGMHPWMDPHAETKLWPHEYSAVYESYNRIFGCSGHGWSNLQSLHINLPFADDVEFGRLHAAIRLILPILPVLAASTPVAGGKTTGLADTRLEYYRNNQKKIPSLSGSVIPEPVFTKRDYEDTIFRRIYADIAPYDPEEILRHEWLNSRGAIARFDRNTIEIRVLDIQECPLADLAISAAVDALIRVFVEEQTAGIDDQKAFPTDRLADLLLAAIRDGERAVVSDREYLKLFGYEGKTIVSTGDLWRHVYETHLAPHLDVRWRETLEIILDRGPLSRRILAALNGDDSPGRIRECFRGLMDCLHNGTMFGA